MPEEGKEAQEGPQAQVPEVGEVTRMSRWRFCRKWGRTKKGRKVCRKWGKRRK